MPSTNRSVVLKSDTSQGAALALGRARILNRPEPEAGGFEFWADGAHIRCFAAYDDPASPGNPANNDVVKDLARDRDGTWRVKAGQVVNYSGNGWAFNGISVTDGSDATVLTIPASVMASIWGNGSVQQYFGIVAYVKLQSAADWNTAETIHPYMSFHGNDETLFTTPDMGTIGSLTSGGQKFIDFYRPISTAAQTYYRMAIPADAPGKFAQIAMWRDAGGVHFALRYDDGTDDGALVSPAPIAGVNATGNFSTKSGRIGAVTEFNSIGPGGIPASSLNWKLYAIGVENTRVSGRDFAEVIADDWLYRLGMKNAGIYA